jgi:hypothetical protein
MKVFLGGTCNGSKWREELISKLRIDFYDPVVENWTPACQAEEIKQRETCDLVLYTITPAMMGVYSIAEAVDDSNKRPEKCIFTLLSSYEGRSFDNAQLKSLNSVCEMILKNGGKVFKSLDTTAIYLNTCKE